MIALLDNTPIIYTENVLLQLISLSLYYLDFSVYLSKHTGKYQGVHLLRLGNEIC